MAASPRRPLPTPPIAYPRYDDPRYDDPRDMGTPGLPALYPYSNPFSFPYSPFSAQVLEQSEEPTRTLRGGTILHKGFYDLLALIPSTPSPSRFFWGGTAQDAGPLAGPRYEDIPADSVPQKSFLPQGPSSSTPVTRNLKPRRVSKDMVSKPTGFMYVSCISL